MIVKIKFDYSKDLSKAELEGYLSMASMTVFARIKSVIITLKKVLLRKTTIKSLKLLIVLTLTADLLDLIEALLFSGEEACCVTSGKGSVC
jgi:hypothetical protein